MTNNQDGTAEQTVIDLGNMSAKAAGFVNATLQGKSFMNFQVSHGYNPGGADLKVIVTTDYDAPEKEIMEFAMWAMAESAGRLASHCLEGGK